MLPHVKNWALVAQATQNLETAEPPFAAGCHKYRLGSHVAMGRSTGIVDKLERCRDPAETPDLGILVAAPEGHTRREGIDLFCHDPDLGVGFRSVEELEDVGMAQGPKLSQGVACKGQQGSRSTRTRVGIDCEAASSDKRSHVIYKGNRQRKTETGLESSWEQRWWFQQPFCVAEIHPHLFESMQQSPDGRLPIVAALFDAVPDTVQLHSRYPRALGQDGLCGRGYIAPHGRTAGHRWRR
jgi:hypothetical protein